MEPNVTTPNLKIRLAKNSIKNTLKSIHLLNAITTNPRYVPEYVLYLYWKQEEKVSIVLHQCVVIHKLIDLVCMRVHNHIIYDRYTMSYTHIWCFMGPLRTVGYYLLSQNKKLYHNISVSIPKVQLVFSFKEWLTLILVFCSFRVCNGLPNGLNQVTGKLNIA